jgi:aspartyl protease family protein
LRTLWIILGLLGAALILLIVNHDQGSILGIQNDRFASAFYLSVWGAVVAAAVLPRTGSLGAAARNAAIWIGVILFLMTGYVYRYELQDIGSRLTGGLIPGSPVSSLSADGRQQAMVTRTADGHFEVSANVNGTSVAFVVDTGASAVVLTRDDAERVGIELADLDYRIPIDTANGRTTAAPAMLATIDIGNIRRYDVQALVARRGDLSRSLLGMTFLETLWGFEIRGDRLILTD